MSREARLLGIALTVSPPPFPHNACVMFTENGRILSLKIVVFDRVQSKKWSKQGEPAVRPYFVARLRL